jgi:Fe-S cluster assembly iron-binding protein IscA
MLKVTENAGQAIESLVANAEMPDGSGLRIDAPDQPPATPDGSGAPLQLEVTSQPAEQDQVVSEGDARVFVAPAAAPILDDKVLDVQVSEDKARVQFVIGPQQSQPGEPG